MNLPEVDYIKFGDRIYVWTDEYREPKDGEVFMSHGGSPAVRTLYLVPNGERAILKLWEPTND